MRSFWDRRARENPYYFIDNRLRYESPDRERFWADGERALVTILDDLGLQLRPGDVVVEIGCGIGRMTRAIAARVDRVIALDVSEEMLARAREHNPGLANVEWMLGDGVSLREIADGSVDACISFVVLQHIPDPKITLGYVREMGRVLRPGGWAAFQVSNDPEVHRPGTHAPLRARAASTARALLGRAPRGRSAPEWLGSAIELDSLDRAAADGGCRVERLAGEGTQFCLVRLRRDQR
jgi:SAM-dependent methyltransferase